jgi:beta-xylosidase
MNKEMNNNSNPILKGEYADPDIRKFGDTYYIYPTTDGFTSWSGTQFSVFSSKDKRNWKHEGVILDVASDDVAWSIGSAWAPCIEEKNGKYYFYFCAKRQDGVSCIGVAAAPSPIGPFKATEEPLITLEMCRELNIKMGQTIDPSIYTENGTSYMLFGNCHAAIVELGDDMISIKKETMKNYEGTFDFREAITVLKKDGKYHFTWSCDDTGSENYHLNYGISDQLYGPIDFQYAVLEKDPSKDILGTGHHSITYIPEDEEYLIAYHRFATPLGRYKEGFGFHREVCLNKVEFDQNTGLMKKIIPTNELV